MKKVILSLVGLFLILILAGCPGEGPPPKPVKVDVPSAVKEIEAKFSCKVGLQKKVYVHGSLDAFASPTDPANQSASVDAWFASSGYGGSSVLADYDGVLSNQYFGDTFTLLPNNIVEAYFITGFRKISSNGNDTLGLGDLKTPTAVATGASLATLAANGWTVNALGNNEKIAARYLSGFGSVLSTMNTTNELDYYVQDDTAVDFAKLVVCYKEKEAKFDLSIEKTFKGEALVIGGTNQYNILITNNGPDAAPGPITVVDVLPTGVVWDNNSPTNWNCTLQSTNPDTVSCTYTGTLPLAANASINLPLTVTVNEKVEKEVKNCAKVIAKGDINSENDQSCITKPTKRPRFDLETKKTSKKDIIKIGDSNSYNIQVTNNGPDAAPGPITVKDTLPAGVVWDGNSPTDWSCSLASTNPDVVSCNYTGSLPLASGDSINLRLNVSVNDKVGDIARNCATTTAQGDINNKNDTSCVTSKVLRKTIIDISTGSLNATTALNMGDADTDWQIITAPATNPYTGDSEVYASGAWTAPHAAHSEWISSPQNNHRGNGHYIFKRNFNITAGMTNCVVNVSRYASDNSSKLDIKNTTGTVLHTESLTSNSFPDFQVGMNFDYTISSPAAGTYSIEVDVNNGSSIMGLLVEAKVTCNP